MLCILGDAGLSDVAFAQALIMLALVGAGMVSGVSGMLYGLVRPTGSTGLPVALGLLALLAGFARAGFFCVVNGDGALEHAARYPGTTILAALPLLLGASTIALATSASGIRGHWLITVLLLLAALFVGVAALLHSLASG